MTTKTPIDALKTSAFDRRLSIAKTSLVLGKRWAAKHTLGWFQSKHDQQASDADFAQAQARYLVDELGKLKGSVVKIGQMLALYGDAMLPKVVVDALHTLDDKTAPLSWQVIYRTLYKELGERIHQLAIEPEPIGTASLAQVHRATIIATGEQIVLKVQYPGVADAIDSDLSLFKQLLKLTNLIPQTRALDTWFDEIRELLYTEVNYQQEAATTEHFFALLMDDKRYKVPKIFRPFCTPRLLAMSFEEGLSLNDKALLNLSQERRNALGQAALDIVIQEIFVWQQMQTDPNFGNYLVRLHDDALDQLVLLDFGAIKHFDSHLIAIAQNLLKAGHAHNKTMMMAAMTGYEFFDTMSVVVKSDMANVFLLATEPFADINQLPTALKQQYWDDSGRYLWAKSDLYNRAARLAGKSMQSKEFSLPPKELMFISRKFIGIYALLSTLGARTSSDSLIQPHL